MAKDEELDNEEEMGKVSKEEIVSDIPDEDDEGFVANEWIGEEEWEDEEEEEDLEVVEEVPTFVDNGDGTVSDSKSNLMWTKMDSYAEFGYGINWFEAHDYCEQLNEKKFAGFDDWRLCSFDDAKSLFSFIKSNQDKDGAEVHIDSVFEPGGGDNTWTYEEKPDYQQYAMKFSFITGNEKWEHKDNEYSHVRFVREIEKDTWEPEWRKDSRQFER